MERHSGRRGAQLVERVLDLWTGVTMTVLISMMWMVTSIPVVTAMASTMAAMQAAERRDEGYYAVFITYVHSFIRFLPRSSVLVIPLILCVLFTVGDLISVIHLHSTWFEIVYIGILIVLDIAVFGLVFHCATFIARTGCNVRHAILSSARHIMTQPARTLAMVSGIFMVILVSVRIPFFGFLFCGALIAWIADHGTVNTSGENV